MPMISYADKVAVNVNAGVPAINKIEAGDMNEIKTALNNYVQTGWYTGNTGTTYTYVSWNATTKIGIVATNQDVTSLLSVGMKVKFTQNATVKYGIIVAISSTQITLFMGTDYTLLNAVITNAFYSMLKAPFGFPTNPLKWSIIVNDIPPRVQNNPVLNTWYNLNSTQIIVPIGMWKLSYSNYQQGYKATAGNVIHLTALSTSLTSISNPKLSSQVFSNPVIDFGCDVYKEDNIVITAETTYYYISSTVVDGQANISRRNLYITALCTYL
jgi:hypothetical protein